MRILITGATGYLGAILTKHLYAQGHETIAWCRSLPEERRLLLSAFTTQTIVGDILDENAMELAKQSKPNVVIHLVSLDHKNSERDIKRASDTNVFATWKILDEFKEINLSKFIYFSTIQVLGNLGSAIVDESFPASPQNVYGLTHHMGEGLMNFYRSKVSWLPIILRLANGYGSPVFKSNNCWWLVVNDLCRMAISEKRIVLQSDGSPQRDFIHVSDIARAVTTIIKTPNPSFSTNLIQVASSNTISILELAITIKTCYSQRFEIDLPIITPNGPIEHSKSRIPELKKYQISTTALAQIGSLPTMSLEQGINELFDYFTAS